MFDPQKLLEHFLGGAKPGAQDQQVQPGQSGMSVLSGGLGQLSQKLGGGLSPDLLKGLAGGAAAGGLASILLGGKGPKKMAETALKVGGTALVAGLAYKVWNDWQASKTGTPPLAVPNPEGTVFLPAPKPERDEMSLALLTAMITAAKADGHIDAEEQKRIFGKLDAFELGSEEKAFLMDEFRKPLDIDSVVRSATSPERAVEIYAASVLAIDPDDPAEQAYLGMLAARLKLAPELKASIEKEVIKVLA